MKQNNSNIFTKLAKDLAKELSSNVEEVFDLLKDNKNSSTENELPTFSYKCNAPQLEETTVIKLQTPVQSNNFSVCLFDEYMSQGKCDKISYFENFNILEVDYSMNTDSIVLTIEDTENPNNKPLESILYNMFMEGSSDLTLSIDLFNKKSELVRSIIFENVSCERYSLANSLKLFNTNPNTNTLKYKVLFSFENYKIY